MSSIPTYTELQRLSADELRAEIARQSAEVEKIRLTITLGKEKNTSKLRRERTHLARLSTALSAAQRSTKQLKSEAEASTVSAPSSRSR